MPGRRGGSGVEGATRGKKLCPAFRKAAPAVPRVVTPLPGLLFAGWILPRS